MASTPATRNITTFNCNPIGSSGPIRIGAQGPYDVDKKERVASRPKAGSLPLLDCGPSALAGSEAVPGVGVWLRAVSP